MSRTVRNISYVLHTRQELHTGTSRVRYTLHRRRVAVFDLLFIVTVIYLRVYSGKVYVYT